MVRSESAAGERSTKSCPRPRLMYPGRPAAARPSPSRETAIRVVPSVATGSIVAFLVVPRRPEPGAMHEVGEPDAVQHALASALEEPERRPLVLRHPEQAAECDAPPLLGAEPARNDDGRGPDRLRQRLDDERVAPRDGRSDQVHDEGHL